MPALDRDLRKELEKAVTGARRLAEAAARASLERLGVMSETAPAGLSEEDRRHRVQLRAKVRAETRAHVIEAIAYVGWHRMLFARFLAENGLLRHPDGAAVTLADVRELAAEEGERDPWVLAARYAAAMLPGIFATGDPVERVSFAPEDRLRLERVLEELPAAVFTADDGLGWVYQFWQSERKKEVNQSGTKIGAAELPAVTQLFTEDYMVRFLLENSLGAWWAGRHPQSPLLRKWEYLRYRDDGTPAAGTFEGWPERAAEVTVMDPCCGSGHFLVAAAGMLRDMRMEEESLSAVQAAAAVIADNLHGLELDPRCLQLAAFNLALDAWKAGGDQDLPVPDLACSGIPVKGQRSEWHRLAGDDGNMRDALDRLYNLFQDAPELGSLIDPRSAAGEGLWRVDTDELLAKLDQALARESATDPAAAVFGDAAKGTAKSARLLADRYWLVATNVPYLGSRGMSVALGGLLRGRGRLRDLAVAMLHRCMGLLATHGTCAAVSPQAWLMKTSYREFRRDTAQSHGLQVVARMGPGAFREISGEVVNPALLVVAESPRREGVGIVDVTELQGAESKSLGLREQSPQVGDWSLVESFIRDGIGAWEAGISATLLSSVAKAYQGTTTGDNPRWIRAFWEVGAPSRWRRLQGSPSSTVDYGGRSNVLFWSGNGEALKANPQARVQGLSATGHLGVAVRQTSGLPGTLYAGDLFDMNVATLVPADQAHLSPIWAFVSSGSHARAVRRLVQSLQVTNATMTKVPFDLEHWTKVAEEMYPDGLPEPHSDDPTQWLFKGNVVGSEAPLQVAVARLLGYRWPDQEPDSLDDLVDADGLVPLTPVAGEQSAAARLRVLLARAYGDAWSPALLERLLAEAGSPGASLETWLRDDFFAQHTKLFRNRPFVWHVWDSRKDGFSVLCHYHRLDRARLEKLTYTLLNDWIERQRAAGDEHGAQPRLNAGLDLQDRLKLIIEGEDPHDVYVRWKSLAEQPIGWEPDLDDGVRVNIRPFVTAGVLRTSVNVKWDKDGGKNPDGSERINDLHPTLAEKREARAAVSGKG